MKKKIAILSPNPFPGSPDSFIQAHKNIDAETFYYYGWLIPTVLENHGDLRKKNYLQTGIDYLLHRFFKSPTTVEKAFVRSLKKNKIDLVFAEFGTTGAAVLPILKKNKIPLSVIFHGFDASKYEVIEKNKAVYKEMFAYAHSIIAVSKVMKSMLIEMGCPPEKITYTPCAPNDSYGNIVLQNKDTQQFISIGRFTSKKAQYYLLLSFKKVLEKYPDSQLVLVGKGETDEILHNLVKYFKIENNVEFAGWLKKEEIIKLISKSAAYVQHSIRAEDGDMEGTPVGVMEAAIAGLPVVSTKHAGIPEVIIDGKSGFLSDEHDVDTMAENMIKILDNPQMAAEMGQFSKKHIHDNFRMEKHLQTISQTLNKN